MATKYVKYRLFSWFAKDEDPYGNEITVEKSQTYGKKVSTEDSGDDPNTVYGLTEKALQFGEMNGCFFSDAEVDAMERGFVTTNMPTATAIEPLHEAPIAVESMDTVMLVQWMNDVEPSADDLLEVARTNPAQAEKILAAASIVGQGMVPAGLEDGLAEILSYGVADEGTEGGSAARRQAPAESQETTDDGSDGSSPPEGSGAEQPYDADDESTTPETPTEETPEAPATEQPEATEAAAALAKEHNVDLSTVTPTGSAGQIIAPDVQKVIDSK